MRLIQNGGIRLIVRRLEGVRDTYFRNQGLGVGRL